MGLGRRTVNMARPLVRPLAQGLEVMLHKRATWELSLWECGDIQTEAVSTHYPGPQASGLLGEMGAQDSLRTVSHRAPKPMAQASTSQVQASKQLQASLPPPRPWPIGSTNPLGQWSPDTLEAGGNFIGHWKRASPASVSLLTFPHLVQCWSVGGGEVRDGVQGSYTSLLEDHLCSWGLSQRG